MLETVICTCGKNLGSVIDLYDFLWNKIKEDYRQKYFPDMAVESLNHDPRFVIEAGALMDILHVELECCRTAMLAKVKISNLK